MSTYRLRDYLGQIEQAACDACRFVEGLGKNEFLADRRTQQAVILNLVIIGEAATRLSKLHPDFLDRHPSVPWASMKGMRNRIAHGYFDLNLNVVWDTLLTALPQLLAALPAVRDDASRADGRDDAIPP